MVKRFYTSVLATLALATLLSLFLPTCRKNLRRAAVNSETAIRGQDAWRTRYIVQMALVAAGSMIILLVFLRRYYRSRKTGDRMSLPLPVEVERFVLESFGRRAPLWDEWGWAIFERFHCAILSLERSPGADTSHGSSASRETPAIAEMVYRAGGRVRRVRFKGEGMERVWEVPMEFTDSYEHGEFACGRVGAVIIMHGKRDGLVGFDLADGKVRWRLDHPGRIYEKMLVIDGEFVRAIFEDRSWLLFNPVDGDIKECGRISSEDAAKELVAGKERPVGQSWMREFNEERSSVLRSSNAAADLLPLPSRDDLENDTDYKVLFASYGFAKMSSGSLAAMAMARTWKERDTLALILLDARDRTEAKRTIVELGDSAHDTECATIYFVDGMVVARFITKSFGVKHQYLPDRIKTADKRRLLPYRQTFVVDPNSKKVVLYIPNGQKSELYGADGHAVWRGNL